MPSSPNESEVEQSSSPGPKISEELSVAQMTLANRKTIQAELNDIAEEIGLPKFGDFTEEAITPELIKAAADEQIWNAENRVMLLNKKGTLVGWENRGKTVLPIWFHLPQGKDVIRRLVSCNRFTLPEIASMLGIKKVQLDDVVKDMGLSKDILRLKTSQKMREYREKIAELCTEAKLKTMVTVLNMVEEYTGERPTRTSVKDLLMLNKITIASEAPPDVGQPPNGVTPSVAIGVKVLQVNKTAKGGGEEFED